MSECSCDAARIEFDITLLGLKVRSYHDVFVMMIGGQFQCLELLCEIVNA